MEAIVLSKLTMSIIWSSITYHHSISPYPKPNPFNSKPFSSFSSPKRTLIQCAKRTQRTGKLRYPSEKKKLKQLHKQKLDAKNKCQGIWRLSRLAVEVDQDPGKDFLRVSDALLQQIAKLLKFPVLFLSYFSLMCFNCCLLQ